MGNSHWSKFKQKLAVGNEADVMKILTKSSKSMKELVATNPIIDDCGNTILHAACAKAYIHVIALLIVIPEINISKVNSKDQTLLHSLFIDVEKYNKNDQKLKTPLRQIIEYDVDNGKRGPTSVDLDFFDHKHNTALHYAAQAGFRECCEILINAKAQVSLVNNDGKAPIDLVTNSSCKDWFECETLFADDQKLFDFFEVPKVNQAEGVKSLNNLQLQSLKDEFIVSISDMLSVPLLTADRLLKHFRWDREKIVDQWATKKDFLTKWIQEVQATIEQPSSTCSDSPCDICFDETGPVKVSDCGHRFCTGCWSEYLTSKIACGTINEIECPASDCSFIVSPDFIESCVDRETARKFVKFDINSFVETCPFLKFCPQPGCPLVVEWSACPKLKNDPINFPISYGVECAGGHTFCWECLGADHSPCGCAQLQSFTAKFDELNPSDAEQAQSARENAANTLWLVANSKKCPNCEAPIQRTDGCNHMKCQKCGDEFCWQCLSAWKDHGSTTGGFFKCNKKDLKDRIQESINRDARKAKRDHKSRAVLHALVQTRTTSDRFSILRTTCQDLASRADSKIRCLHRRAVAFEICPRTACPHEEERVSSSLPEDQTHPPSEGGQQRFVSFLRHALLVLSEIAKPSQFLQLFVHELPKRKPKTHLLKILMSDLNSQMDFLSSMVTRDRVIHSSSEIVAQTQIVCDSWASIHATLHSSARNPPVQTFFDDVHDEADTTMVYGDDQFGWHDRRKILRPPVSTHNSVAGPSYRVQPTARWTLDKSSGVHRRSHQSGSQAPARQTRIVTLRPHSSGNTSSAMTSSRAVTLSPPFYQPPPSQRRTSYTIAMDGNLSNDDDDEDVPNFITRNRFSSVHSETDDSSELVEESSEERLTGTRDFTEEDPQGILEPPSGLPRISNEQMYDEEYQMMWALQSSRMEFWQKQAGSHHQDSEVSNVELTDSEHTITGGTL